MRTHSAVVACIAALLAPGSALAQAYPAKPIRIVIPQAPGSQSELFARMLGQEMTKGLGQAVVNDARPGAGGMLGAEIAAKAPPDGYTLLMATNSTHGSNPALYSKLPYDPVKDFAPIALTVGQPYVLAVHPSLPVTNLKELIALARSKPGQLNYGSPGNGSTHQLCAELLKTTAHINLIHVPYKGSPPATAATMSGEVSMMFNAVGSISTLVQGGKLRALAVTTAKRSSRMPDVPTMTEGGVPGFDIMSWFGLVAPANTPRPIIERLNAETIKALGAQEIKTAVSNNGLEFISGTPEQFAAHIKAEIARFTAIAKAAHIRLD